jgi:hypothetical protein
MADNQEANRVRRSNLFKQPNLPVQAAPDFVLFRRHQVAYDFFNRVFTRRW